MTAIPTSTTQSSPTDEWYIRRCLQLATNGTGHVSPNPMVGCVIVNGTSIVAEGFHQEYGYYHAERNAILRTLADATPNALRGATLYVNLEPCAHHGHTPPCANLIAEAGIAKVVCCNDDPNPLVAGRGFNILHSAGIEVVQHVLEAEGREFNRRFFTYMEQQRPYVILKWAESADGYMAPSNRQDYWLSTSQQNRINHRWRTEEAAILIGSSTYLADTPSLTARHYATTRQPQPIVLDRRHRIQTLPPHWLHLHTPDIRSTLAELHQHKIQSVIVEGGRQILDAFIDSGYYDEVRILRSPIHLGTGLKAPAIPPLAPRRITIIT